MKSLVVWPVLIPLITGLVLLPLRQREKISAILSLSGSLIYLLLSVRLLHMVLTRGIQVVHVGDWPAPYGITLVADLFSGIMVVLTGIIGLTVVIFSLISVDKTRKNFGYFPLIFFLIMGVSGSFLTGDLFNLYVWFEVMLMSSFVLLVLGGERPQLEGALKYVTLNLIGSTLFLVGVGILYGKTGTLNMADLAFKLKAEPQSVLLSGSAILLLIAFGIKAGAFPFYFWLPASYHTPPAAVSALFAGLLTKVGVYAMVRVFSLIFARNIPWLLLIILILAGFTMILGVLGAASQYEIRKILSFHIISQIGYMLMGLGLFSPLALAGAVFYIMHHIVVKTNLFLSAGMISLMEGSNDLKRLGGIYRKLPLLSFIFFIPAMSLAGIPPLSGFWAKFSLIKAGIELGNVWIVFVALLVSLITLFSMTKIWAEAFWKKAPDTPSERPLRIIPAWQLIAGGYAPMVLLLLITLLMGFYAEPFFQLALKTAHQLIQPAEYINAVLGRGFP
jgi:multicomponent Na+:H+ antiporter subunit D